MSPIPPRPGKLHIGHYPACADDFSVLLPPTTDGLRARFRATVFGAVDDTYPELTGHDHIEGLVGEHALFQLENLQMHPFIRDRLDAKLLKLHLWIVNDQTARTLAYTPHLGDLVPIEEMR
ncbi:carbonic anhydrase [Bythopirellula goksoeyrii]|uniref:Carbonic anhydrase n=1 Tax=Bythopirellula goksoeyrii TaxID=1400387 RepID=A0A5B9QI17_9BACT|nr:hypothetical protein [Bythopirellula goksoeyrii]QEG37599.1 Carbonic anhydrase [Bythopirellula goksoeyrii]